MTNIPAQCVYEHVTARQVYTCTKAKSKTLRGKIRTKYQILLFTHYNIDNILIWLYVVYTPKLIVANKIENL
jgi:hypothetical protein